ncbi:Fe-S cluster assembly protein SufB [Candidatus Marsarchaeota G2 archaeon OSP_D]|uniref:Fe-S cluster assembly protein SufB n=3 Tax=Candidatus Marsarchaeota group 2 TaxID=2203771 RepID=A0A2R6AYN7_9ARCH|nr:MAG: Fe-S cluster assembly protein SufB [Candidatus Marsarchaeota G2 archaeon ECH_B_SAG-M15]PSN92279.1 MAG: Fe-S cluster assembly protein SufB [Candidatus Marsarchaeota G2 archaeon OSP_D]PSN94192.1 MAG: Fe-S cluster assembly protein SufB [Candidatus Marsarchaeota G2 archaeon ECH_B_SAG-C16]
MDYSKYDFKEDTKYVYVAEKGLSRSVVEEISRIKGEPEWMRKFRLHALDVFNSKPLPTWGPDLSGIDFNSLRYYLKPTEKKATDWNELPEDIRRTFERLGIPEAERKYFAGVGAQYDSESVYHSIKEELSKKGVIFVDTDTAVKQYPELVKKYFGTIVPPEDNKFAALNSAVWSGGSFVYVPKGVEVDIPLQAYFRINASNMGQFERTLIIVEEGAKVHYMEGCTAPVYSTDSLHAAVVEIIAKEGARVRYTTIQNWSRNVYNLVTKRAYAYRNATVEWVDANIGSKVTMKYPSVYLLGPGARGEVISVAIAGKDQHLDAGAKMIHMAPNTTSRISSKSISMNGGRTTYRGLLRVAKGATNVKSSIRCDALLLDEYSATDTYPYNEIYDSTASATHEATVGKISQEQIFYLMSRGIPETKALTLIVMGFIEEFTKELPLEFVVELNKLINMEFENTVG